ncbi:uncharacterized protein METZ01_LOCUS262711, partial [marine metagenome]
MALAVFLIVHTSVQTVRVEGVSMGSTLNHGQFLIVNKLAYKNLSFQSREPSSTLGNRRFPLFHFPILGDVIVFHLPDDPTRDLIKRVIGVPGDTVGIENGVVYVNGLPLQESYIRTRDTGYLSPVLIRPAHYFVLGDNRKASSDSRLLGQIPLDNIVGEAWLSYWPLSNFGTLSSVKRLF